MFTRMWMPEADAESLNQTQSLPIFPLVILLGESCLHLSSLELWAGSQTLLAFPWSLCTWQVLSLIAEPTPQPPACLLKGR